MEKGKLIESIRQAILRQQPNLDSNKHAHFLTMEVEIEKAYNSALKEFYANDKNLENAELDFYAKKYTCNVLESLGVRYIELPAKPIELKRNLGIRSVRPKSTISGMTGSTSFIRTSDSELELIKDLEVYCCSKKAFYYIDGTKVVISYPVKEWALIETVELKMLPVFSAFEMEDNIEFPMGEMQVTAALLNIMGIRPVNNFNADDIR